MSRDHPILFSSPMIMALLASRKTQTRRVLKPHPIEGIPSWGRDCKTPYVVGDHLWVREALYRDKMANFLTGERTTNADVIYYVADNTEAVDHSEFNFGWIWKRGTLSSIHMPRWVSRLTLTVTDVRVQRLQEISEEDAVAEGVDPIREHPASIVFSVLWDKINGAGSWNKSPWVAAYTFTVEQRNIDDAR